MEVKRKDEMLMCYYGDDFTGSTDAMEALTVKGLRTVLFLSPPDPLLLAARFANVQCIGIAGTARAMSPEQMDDELLPILKEMIKYESLVIHYKLCSTFDSSPKIGNIGKVIEYGLDLFPEQSVIPLLVGSPLLKRYTVFGHHFASADHEIYRIDKHPTMSRHPITPMDEADLIVHLGKQSKAKVSLMSILDLSGDSAVVQAKYHERLLEDPDLLLFDILDDNHLESIGLLLSSEIMLSGSTTAFMLGSSSIEYALAEQWRLEGKTEAHLVPNEAEPVDRLLVISGSCSPVTQGQIDWALANGFHGIRIPVAEFLEDGQLTDTFICLFQEAEQYLNQGTSVVLYTALGPDDPAIQATRNWFEERKLSPTDSGKLLGSRMGKLARKLVIATSLNRVIFAGGDSSGYAVKELGIYALEMKAQLTRGAPLCRCYSEEPLLDGLEVLLKGGQVGDKQYFGNMLAVKR